MEHPRKRHLPLLFLVLRFLPLFTGSLFLLSSLALGPCQFYLSMLVRILQPFENGPLAWQDALAILTINEELLMIS